MSARHVRVVLGIVFTITGFSALTLQVVWQRVISLHGGVDLVATTTVVAAFLGGLGVGSLVGGVLADRLGPRRSLGAFAASNAGIAAYALVSIWLFYDLYEDVLPRSTSGAFAFNVGLLVVPTMLMGLSLPLVSRGAVRGVHEIAPVVGRLYALNTLGAAAGAAVSGWYMLGTFGFSATVRLAAALNLLAAVMALLLWSTASVARTDSPHIELSWQPTRAARAWPWMVLYGLTGAVALGLEVVFFRIVDSIMRSNSYSFGHVLSLYLALFGAGAAIGARFVHGTTRPARWFLWLQYAAGVTAVGGVLLLLIPLKVPSFLGIRPFLESYFRTDGFASGFEGLGARRFVFANVVAPLLVMGAPVLLLGASFPFIQAVVARQFETVGRRTGGLLFANIAGNVAGTLVTGFVLLDRIGTSGTLRLLSGCLVVTGIAAAATYVGIRRVVLIVAAVAVVTFAVAVFPSNRVFWAFLHGAPPEDVVLAEERSCVNSLVRRGTIELLYINGASQNGYPYDDFHTLIGMTPAFMHEDPRSAMAVGLGIGATTFGMAMDQRLDTVDTVEICGGEIELLQDLARRGSKENRRLFEDDRLRLQVGDGRKFLLDTDAEFDVITVDTLRPQSGYSGNLYSVEFYELVKSRLASDGLFAQWAPTARALATIRHAFPHATLFTVPTYNNSQFVVAGERPVVYDRAEVTRRVERADLRSLPAGLADSLRKFFADVQPQQLPRPGAISSDALNRDLTPRDEYFLNN